MLKRISVSPLKARQTKKNLLLINLPTGVSALGQFILAVVDADDSMEEIRERNNEIAFGLLP